MAGNTYGGVGQRTEEFAAPARALSIAKPQKQPMPKSTASTGFDKTMSVPKPRPVYAAQLQRQPQFGRMPRSAFGIANTGIGKL